ncbi:MAG: CapA family protein [Lachnospiraceae bacterium]|nr:CapA family protein [Lachnospiraceae bacterium]
MLNGRDKVCKKRTLTKKLITALGIILLVVPMVLCTGEPICAAAASLPRYKREEDGVWRLKSRKGKNSKKDDKTELKTQEEQNEIHGQKTAVCMFTGDLMCLKGQQYDAGKKGRYDFSPSFSYVKPIFKTSDFVCANLETLISESNPLTRNQLEENEQPQCNGPKAYLSALKKAGFDMLVTANNHTCDWGPEGITETKKQLDETGFANVGTHYNAEGDAAGERFSVFDVNGIKIAVLSYTHHMNQRAKMTSDEMTAMVHLFSKEAVKSDIADAREKGADFVVVYLHYGSENVLEANSTQVRDSDYVAEAGADLIIGSHPHCLQPCKYIKTSDGRKVLCMYSLGNFVSSMARDINNDTLILRVEITKKTEKKKTTIKMTDASYIPCKVMARNGAQFVVTPTNAELNGGIRGKSLSEARERIGAVMGGVIPEYSVKQ